MKSYKRLDSSPISKTAESTLLQKEKASCKQIIPTSAISGVREDLKKIFLPLLIDVFELRQMVENYKTCRSSPHLDSLGKLTKSPEEVVERLQQLQNDVEESQRWCSGVILQIAKGIDEARDLLAEIGGEKTAPPPPKEKLSLLKKMVHKIKR